MRQIRWRRTRVRAMIIILLIAAGLCLSARLFSVGLSSVKKKSAGGGYSAGLAAFIWKGWYPAYGNSGRSPKEETEQAVNGEQWLVKFILRQVPYYRMAEEKGGRGGNADPDPAYKDYLEGGRIWKEYEYLVSGLSDSAVLASGNNPLSPGNTPGVFGGSGMEGNNPVNGAADASGITASDMDSVLSRVEIMQDPAGSELLKGAGLTVKGTQYIQEQLADYDFLMKHFYAIHPSTTAGRDVMKAETFLSEDFSLEQGNESPQILIYHTHSQEEFTDYHSGNGEATIVGVGNYLTELLKQKGYNVIHDTSVYDLKDGKLDRSKAYTYALDGITGILQKYPSIQVVLDVHRDGVKEGTHLVQEVNGKQTASIMFFNGTSQTPTGPIEYLKNPYRTDNMAFSFQLKLCADAYYPGFTRKIYLKGLRYNMHLRPRSALIEVGAQTNTYEEARNAMEPLSELLDMVLKSK